MPITVYVDGWVVRGESGHNQLLKDMDLEAPKLNGENIPKKGAIQSNSWYLVEVDECQAEVSANSLTKEIVCI